MKRPVQNLSRSIRDRLLNLAKARNEEFQHFLMRYGLERRLYRLSLTPHRERFVLKGAMLFAIWSDEPHRPTQDLDLLGFGSSSITELETVFREIYAVAAEEDGLQFQRSMSALASDSGDLRAQKDVAAGIDPGRADDGICRCDGETETVAGRLFLSLPRLFITAIESRAEFAAVTGRLPMPEDA